MQSVARFSPFGPDMAVRFDWNAGDTLLTVVRRAIDAMEKRSGQIGAFEWFMQHGIVRVNGIEWARDMWRFTRAKAGTVLSLHAPAPEKGKAGRIGLLLAAVALTVATGFIASGGIATVLGLGAASTFAAGGVGAYIAAGVFGALGSLALRALTPAPSLGGSADTERRELSSAGISGNALSRDEYLINVIGRMRVSPQQLVRSWTTLEGDRLFAHGLMGVNGQCDFTDVKLNGVDIAEFSEVQLDIAAGTDMQRDTFLSTETVVQDAAGVVLSTPKTQTESTDWYDRLVDQVTPDNSLQTWHPFVKKAGATRFLLRLLFEGGLVDNQGNAQMVPLRIEVRQKGTTTWRKLPTLHIKDTKASGPFRREVELVWGRQPKGRHYCRNEAYDIFLANRITGAGQSFEYQSDSYFTNNFPTNAIPVMTAATTSGVTMSASTQQAGFEAWRACDGNDATAWATSVAPPGWIEVNFGAGNLKTIRSIMIKEQPSNQGYAPRRFKLLARNSTSDPWTELHVADEPPNSMATTGLMPRISLQVDNNVAWRYYRVDVSETYSANLEIGSLILSEEDAAASDINSWNRFSGPTENVASHVSLTYEGAKIYLDPATWPEDEYDIRVMRGWAGRYDLLDLIASVGTTNDEYSFDGTTARAHFFSYQLNGGYYTIHQTQRSIQSKTMIEAVTQYHPERPIRQAVEYGLSRIALRIPDIRVESVSVLATAYARPFTGGVWSDVPVPCRRPAAFYRDALLLSGKTAEPLPGEVIDESSLATAYLHCETNDITCDTLVHNRSVPEVLQLLAASMRATPSQADLWGITIDHDRSAEQPVGMLTPENSRNLGTEIDADTVPHGYRVQFMDEADNYERAEVIVYRDGYSAANATLLEKIEDNASTTSAKAAATGLYNLRQLQYRKARHKRECGPEGRYYRKGDLIAVADEVVQRDLFFGLIKAIRTSGGNVVGFDLYSDMKLSESAASISMASDINAVANINTFSGTFGCAVRMRNGLVMTAQITQSADTNFVTLQTPVANTGQFVVDREIAIGPLGREMRRMVLHSKRRVGEDRWQLNLLAEAPEIFN